ncbi:DEAD-domain-containing protein [Xylona heveae TC161]|uniref:RNA helicase n=1 Tax=Xylona heveae (strain CBS 132557 / TC161) TaxID=1328760 RepID=A0A165HZ15_XYLHT|nr:DEAD-domain-containing protein [Xylona heveae TC161]KZF24119.1 DEAD-domain-containing protein [Xylona heveae TC161]
MSPQALPNEEDDFILTLSDEDIATAAERTAESSRGGKSGLKRRAEDISPERNKKKTKKSRSPMPYSSTSDDEDLQDEEDAALNSDFEFQPGDATTTVLDDFDGWTGHAGTAAAADPAKKQAVDLDDIIARRRQTRDQGSQPDSSDNDASENEEELSPSSADEEDEDDIVEDEKPDNSASRGIQGIGSENGDDEASDDDSIASPVAHPDDLASDTASDDDEDENPTQLARREAFFAPAEEGTTPAKGSKASPGMSFQSMSLSRPILRGLASVGFSEPTPIQSKTIPVALLGKDIVGGAVTGSGKTAAFVIPILERLLYRPKKVPTSRVVILMPTRELAVQCFNVAKKLASFTDITFCQLVGGFSLREQENVLKTRPDVIIATPGRFIDHMRNSASFTVDTLEILVLDEADRMLEDGFADELNEILTTIPKSRQTMLFSATMTQSIDKLIRVGLNRPVRLMVDNNRRTVGTLVQEFVRLRPGREDKRLGYLMVLCKSVYTEKTIIFFRQKKEAHRVRIVFGLAGLTAGELHGSMSQEQRMKSLEAFRNGKVSFLLATDVASRGLDIKGIETVINYEAPQSHEIYLHRVGRTARAGRSGRACTIAAEPDRKIVKAAVKTGRNQGAKIVSRLIGPSEADKWAQKVEAMGTEIEEILKEEKQEKQLAQAEMHVKRGENLIAHEEEIKSRPRRTWFESEKQKQASKQAGFHELNAPDAVQAVKEKRKLSGKEKKQLEDREARLGGKVWKKGKTERSGLPTKKPGAGKKGGKNKANLGRRK